jgi:hypothetical protein
MATDVKQCSRCKSFKPISEFGKNKTSKDGFAYECKVCRRFYYARYYSDPENRKRVCAKALEYEKTERSKELRKISEAKPDRIEKRQKWEEEYRQQPDVQEMMKESKQKYAKSDKGRESQRRHRHTDRHKARMRTWNKKNRLRKFITRSIYRSLKGNKKGQHWEGLVDFTLEGLKSHLESQFQPGMTWDNYGEWHVDHIRPVSSFYITSPCCDDFKKCWSLDNLQPLWAKDNLRKGAKWSDNNIY